MKKLFLIIFLSLISFNLNAFEQVIGGSVGYGIAFSKGNHYQTNKYVDKSTTDPRPDITLTWDKEEKNIDNGYNFDVEYQIRAENNGFWVLGIGFKSEVISINSSYKIIEGDKLTTQNPYIIGLATFYEGKDLSLRIGASVGQAMNKVGNITYDNITADMIFDAEYSLSSNFMFFSRINIAIASGKSVQYSTNLMIDESVEATGREIEILDNHIKMNAKDQLMRLNFGIRYRI